MLRVLFVGEMISASASAGSFVRRSMLMGVTSGDAGRTLASAICRRPSGPASGSSACLIWAMAPCKHSV